eukprot:TRINITY_DN6662_c0_g1_i9.p1 TRINITY_DN6662_c0_g1~~TRINITY_DN6662_c0_g1_i9.p1  ORF type:complete len:708 (-),score=168.28 TRINITY_DN6662_c0_g1_i9:1629-3752(-)
MIRNRSDSVNRTGAAFYKNVGMPAQIQRSPQHGYTHELSPANARCFSPGHAQLGTSQRMLQNMINVPSQMVPGRPASNQPRALPSTQEPYLKNLLTAGPITAGFRTQTPQMSANTTTIVSSQQMQSQKESVSREESRPAREGTPVSYPKWKNTSFRGGKTPVSDDEKRKMDLNVTNQSFKMSIGEGSRKGSAVVTKDPPEIGTPVPRGAKVICFEGGSGVPSEPSAQSIKTAQNIPSVELEKRNGAWQANSEENFKEYRSLQDKLNFIEEKIKRFKAQYVATSGVPMPTEDSARNRIAQTRNSKENLRVKDLGSAAVVAQIVSKESAVRAPEQQEMNTRFPSRPRIEVNPLREKQDSQSSDKHPATSNPGLSGFVTQVPKMDFGGRQQRQQEQEKEKEAPKPTVPLNIGRPPTPKMGDQMSTWRSMLSASPKLPQQIAPAALTPSQKSSYFYFLMNQKEVISQSGNEELMEKFRDHLFQLVQGLQFVRRMNISDDSQLESKAMQLRKRYTHLDKKTVVFDLDETLIHCNENADVPSDVTLPITFPSGEVIRAGINIRPYAVETLREVSKYYEVIVFTASHSCYANKVIDHLDPRGEFVHHRLFREHCIATEEGIYIKDLRIFVNRRLEDLILVDNASYSFAFQMDNGVPIVPFYDNKADVELQHLVNFLRDIATVPDVRPTLRKIFRMNLLDTCSTVEEAYEKLTTA